MNSSNEMSPLRKLFSGTLKYSLGGLAGRALQIISMPLYLRYLTTGEYGVQSIALLNENILGILAGYAITNGISKYYMESRHDPERQGKVIGTALSFLVLIGIAFLVGIECFAGFVAHWSLDSSKISIQVIRLIGLSFFANLFVNLVLAMWQLDERIGLFIWSNLFKQVISVTVGVVLVVYVSAGVVGAVIGWVTASVVMGLFSMIWVWRRFKLAFDREILMSLLKFGLPLVPAAFLMLLLNGFDRYLLKQMAGLSIVGIYAANFTLAAAVNLALVSPFKQMWAPILWKMRHQPDEADLHRRTLTYYSVVQIFVICGLTLFSDLGMRILSGGRATYVSVSGMIPIVYFGIALYGTYDVTAAGYFFEAKTHFYTITVFVATAFNIALNCYLIPKISLWGCAITYALSYMVFAALSYRYGQRFFRVQFEWGRILKACAVGLAVAGLGLWARTWTGWRGVVLAGITLSAYPFALWATSFFNPSELILLRDQAQRYFPR